MLTRQNFFLSLSLTLFAIPACADPLVYLITGSQQFGQMNLATGAFSAISSIPGTIQYLVPGPNGSLLTMSFDGNLDSINPATGAISVIGATGFGDCTTPASPCPPNSQLSFGTANGVLYATDFQNRLYTINALTGKATLIGNTGIPAVPANPTSTNPDGSFNFYDENLFGVGGKLYANFDAATFNPATSVITTLVSPALYQMDLNTGSATEVASTDLGLVTITDVNGTPFGFNGGTGQLVTLDVTNGKTTFVRDIDPSFGLIEGAAVVTPEPASMILAALGIIGILSWRRQALRQSILASTQAH